MNSTEIKGPPRVSFSGLHSGGSFYISPLRLTGAGSVNTRPGTKQGSSCFSETVDD